MSVRSFLRLESVPVSVDAALLLLRAWFGGVLFLKHGLDKLMNYSTMVTHFPDPLHLGAHFSIAFAFFSDAICSLFVVFGFGTRVAVLFNIINMAVVYCVVDKFALFPARNGELPLLFLGGFLAIFIAGPGRFSIDAKMGHKS